MGHHLSSILQVDRKLFFLAKRKKRLKISGENGASNLHLFHPRLLRPDRRSPTKMDGSITMTKPEHAKADLARARAPTLEKIGRQARGGYEAIDTASEEATLGRILR